MCVCVIILVCVCVCAITAQSHDASHCLVCLHTRSLSLPLFYMKSLSFFLCVSLLRFPHSICKSALFFACSSLSFHLFLVICYPFLVVYVCTLHVVHSFSLSVFPNTCIPLVIPLVMPHPLNSLISISSLMSLQTLKQLTL